MAYSDQTLKLISESAGSEIMSKMTRFSGKKLKTQVLEHSNSPDGKLWLIKIRITWEANFSPLDYAANLLGDARSSFDVTGILEVRKDNLGNSKFRITQENNNVRAVRIGKFLGENINVSISVSF